MLFFLSMAPFCLDKYKHRHFHHVVDIVLGNGMDNIHNKIKI